jgi:hypothetical protein
VTVAELVRELDVGFTGFRHRAILPDDAARQMPMTLLALGLVMSVGTPETGPLEKAVAALAIVAVVAAAGPVRRIGSAS